MKTASIMKLVAMILMAVTFVFIVVKYKALHLALCSLVVLGGLIIYIVFVVGIFGGSEVDAELTQFWDILGMGAFFALGMVLTLGNTSNTSGDNILIMISGILAIATSVILLLDAIFTS